MTNEFGWVLNAICKLSKRFRTAGSNGAGSDSCPLLVNWKSRESVLRWWGVGEEDGDEQEFSSYIIKFVQINVHWNGL